MKEICGDAIQGGAGEDVLDLFSSQVLFGADRQLHDFWPWRIDRLAADEVRAIRRHSRATLSTFAGILNLPETTLAEWEAGVSEPHGAALLMLTIIRNRGLSALATLAAASRPTGD